MNDKTQSPWKPRKKSAAPATPRKKTPRPASPRKDTARGKVPAEKVPAQKLSSDRTSGETVSGAGRIEDLFEGKGRNGEDGSFGELDHAVFAALDEQRLRSEADHAARGAHDVALAAQHARLFVVDDQDADPLQEPIELGPPWRPGIRVR